MDTGNKKRDRKHIDEQLLEKVKQGMKMNIKVRLSKMFNDGIMITDEQLYKNSEIYEFAMAILLYNEEAAKVLREEMQNLRGDYLKQEIFTGYSEN